MYPYLSNELFVNHVLENGVIRFAVKANLGCEEKLSFDTHGIHIYPSPSTLQGYAFAGEIEIRERSLEGVRQALRTLESWADMLCLTVGSSKIIVRVLPPSEVHVHFSPHLNSRTVGGLAKLTQRFIELHDGERERFSNALWWYRKACVARDYSIFDSFTACWNSLEILCNVSGGKISRGPEIDRVIQDYLKSKRITSGVINECYRNFVQYSIRNQMEDALSYIFPGEAQREQWIYYCFEVLPDKDRLYQIRNDINHGNIRENSREDYERVFIRGIILAELVRRILYRKLGGSKSSDEENVDTYVTHTLSTGGTYDIFILYR